MRLFFIIALLAINCKALCQEVKIFPNVVVKGDAFVERLAVVPDGYLLTRTMDHINGQRVSDLVKVNLLGDVDESFASVEVNSNILAVFPQGNKIIVAGSFTSFNGVAKSFLRLNSDGTIDDNFQPLSISTGFITNLKRQADGKIIAVGQFQSGAYQGLVRLHEDGSLDNSFAATTPPDGYYMNSAIDANDNIYAVGNSKVMKFDANGNIQSGFPVSFDGYVAGLSVWEDKVIVTGNFSKVNGISRNNFAVINADGSVNPLTLNIPSLTSLSQSILLPNEKLAISHSNGVNLFSLTGAFEKELARGQLRGIYKDESDRLIIIGTNKLRTLESLTPFMVRLTSELTIDNTFNCKPTLTAGLTAIDGYPDGRVVVGGDFSIGGFNDRSDRIVRINPSGTLDESFNPPPFDNVWGVTVQPDGKVLVSAEKLVRLNASGSLDNTFQEKIPEESFQGIVRTKLRESSIFTSGSFKILDGHSSPGIAKLQMNGAMDNSFTSGLPNGAMVYDFAFQSDGKIIVVGAFEIGGKLYGVGRLNTDGTLDSEFIKFPILGNYIRRVVIDSNNKIYAAGEPWKFVVNSENLLTKLNEDGSVDAGFTSPFTLIDQSITGLELINDNQIIVGMYGWFDDTGKPVITTTDALGNIVDMPYSVAKFHESVLATSYDGNTIFITGRLLSNDKSLVSAIGTIPIHQVSGGVNNLQAVREDQSNASLSWNNTLTHQSLIVIERSTSDNSNFFPIDTISGDATGFSDTHVPDHLAYIYRVRGLNSNSFSEYSNESMIPFIEPVTGIEKGVASIYAFPNPSDGNLKIQISEKLFGASLTIMDSKGILKTSIEAINQSLYQIDLQGLSPGVYIIQLRKGKSAEYLKIVKCD